MAIQKQYFQSFTGPDEEDKTVEIDLQKYPNINHIGVQSSNNDDYFILNYYGGQSGYEIHLGEKKQWEILSEDLPLVQLYSIILRPKQICYISYLNN